MQPATVRSVQTASGDAGKSLRHRTDLAHLPVVDCARRPSGNIGPARSRRPEPASGLRDRAPESWHRGRTGRSSRGAPHASQGLAVALPRAAAIHPPRSPAPSPKSTRSLWHERKGSRLRRHVVVEKDAAMAAGFGARCAMMASTPCCSSHRASATVVRGGNDLRARRVHALEQHFVRQAERGSSPPAACALRRRRQRERSPNGAQISFRRRLGGGAIPSAS